MTREEISKEKHKDLIKEQKKEKAKNIIKKIIKIALFIIIITTAFFFYTTYISTVMISTREYRIINKKIPDSFNGTKIVQFSDLHYGTTMIEENLSDIKKKINILKPDIIVFTGDLINHDYKMKTKDTEILTQKLKELNASLGKYAILGDEDNEEIISIYNQANFIVLRNENDLIYKSDNNPIILIGLSSLINNEQDIEKGYSYFNGETYNSNIYTITLVHEPDSADDIINSYKTDLLLSGHSHNGNIRVPFINYTPIRKNGAKKYYQDYYNIDGTKLYISSGLGTNNASGIRLFCRPSINLYRLSNK